MQFLKKKKKKKRVRMWKAAGHQTQDSLSSLSRFFLFGFLSRRGGFFFSYASFFLLPPPDARYDMNQVEFMVQERLRRDSATTCAHCFSLIFTVSGGSSAIKKSNEKNINRAERTELTIEI